LATNRVVRTKEGERAEHPQYHTVFCWDRLAEQTGKHVTKGRLVWVEGRLESRSLAGGVPRSITRQEFAARAHRKGPGQG
jgi:single-strand DNA-binding protein